MMRTSSSSGGGGGGGHERRTADDGGDTLIEQERELERLRKQLARLERGARRATLSRGGDASGGISNRSSRPHIEVVNYVVEKRAAATHDREQALLCEDPDVWAPPPPPARRPERVPPRRPPPPAVAAAAGAAAVPAAAACSSSPPPPPPVAPQPGSWAQQASHPGSVGPIGRRPAVLSRPGGGTVLYPGGGGNGGAPLSSSSSSSICLTASATAKPLLTLQPPPPPPLPPFSSHLPPACHHHHQHQHQHEEAALIAALEREVSGAAAAAASAPAPQWDDIAGLSAAKRVLQEAAVLPLLLPALFTGIRRPPKGLLLHGPPGTGKTMLARAVAREAGPLPGGGGGGIGGGANGARSCAFLSASAATLASKYRGESERLVRALFALARARAPCVVFLDEIDAIGGRRGSDGEHEASRRFKAELLVQIDACAAWAQAQQQQQEQQQQQQEGELHHHQQQEETPPLPRHVLVLAATNHPWDLDDALRRRLEKRVYVPLPDEAQRRELLALCLKGVDSALDPAKDLPPLARRLEGYSCDDVTGVCREAALAGVRRTVAGKSPAEVRAMARAGGAAARAAAGPVTRRDFDEAIARVRPSVSAADAARHEAWSREFGSA